MSLRPLSHLVTNGILCLILFGIHFYYYVSQLMGQDSLKCLNKGSFKVQIYYKILILSYDELTLIDVMDLVKINQFLYICTSLWVRFLCNEISIERPSKKSYHEKKSNFNNIQGKWFKRLFWRLAMCNQLTGSYFAKAWLSNDFNTIVESCGPGKFRLT